MKKIVSAVLLVVIIMSCATAALASVSIYTVGSCHLRKSASLDGASICTVPAGVTLTATANQDDWRGVRWYKVSYKGKTGWVSSVYAKVGVSPTAKKGVIASGSTYIRAKADKTSTALGTLSAGKCATYLGKSSVDYRGVRWYKISYNGIVGWVSSVNTYIND